MVMRIQHKSQLAFTFGMVVLALLGLMVCAVPITALQEGEEVTPSSVADGEAIDEIIKRFNREKFIRDINLEWERKMGGWNPEDNIAVNGDINDKNHPRNCDTVADKYLRPGVDFYLLYEVLTNKGFGSECNIFAVAPAGRKEPENCNGDKFVMREKNFPFRFVFFNGGFASYMNTVLIVDVKQGIVSNITCRRSQY